MTPDLPPQRLAVIGLGAMGANHVRVASELGLLAAVADVSDEARAKAAKAYKVPAHADPAEAMKAADAVVIATPTSTHAALALKAIALGKHVLVEKPMAATPAEAQHIIDAAHAAGLTLAVGHVERHNPIVRFAKETLASRDVGDLLSLTARRVSNFPGRIRDVGCILDIGIHEIDIARHLAGGKVERVHALVGSGGSGSSGAQPNGHEDRALVHLGFDNGIHASIETNWMTPMRVRKNTLTCSKALVEIDYMEQAARISSSQFVGAPERTRFAPEVEYNVRQVTLRRQEPLRNEHEDFADAVRRRRAPLVTGEDGLAALVVADAAIRSARERRAIVLWAEGTAALRDL